MRPVLRSRLGSGRRQRNTGAFCALLFVLWAALGCFGGQTGTELTPTPNDKTNGEGTPGSEYGNAGGRGTGGGVTEDTTTPTQSPPTLDGSVPCDGSEETLKNLENTSGLTIDAAVKALQRTNPFTLTFGDGTTGSAIFEVTPQLPPCAGLPTDGRRVLNVPVNVRIASADARVVVVLSGTAVAFSGAQGGVAKVELDADVECESNTWGDALSVCTSIGADMSGFASARLSLSTQLVSIGEKAQLFGVLSIAGRGASGCGEEQKDCVLPEWVSVADISLSRIE